MRKTFEELVEKEYYFREEVKVVEIEDCLELMRLVRLHTIKECSDKAEADFNIINTSMKAEYFREENIECYVLKESILGLDKDSIDV